MSGYVIGKKVKLPNGHEYIAAPYIAFHTREQAESCADMVERVSGERPGIEECSIYEDRANITQFRNRDKG